MTHAIGRAPERLPIAVWARHLARFHTRDADTIQAHLQAWCVEHDRVPHEMTYMEARRALATLPGGYRRRGCPPKPRALDVERYQR